MYNYDDIRYLSRRYLNRRDTDFLLIVSGYCELPQLPPDMRRYIYKLISENIQPDPVYFPENHQFSSITNIEVQQKLIQDMIEQRVIVIRNNQYYHVRRERREYCWDRAKKRINRDFFVRLFYDIRNPFEIYGYSDRYVPDWYAEEFSIPSSGYDSDSEPYYSDN